MDNLRLLRACEMRDAGNLQEAVAEFIQLACDTREPMGKADLLLNAATTLSAMGKGEEARRQLSAAKALLSQCDPHDPSTLQLRINAEFEDAKITQTEGKNEEALVKLNTVLANYVAVLRNRDFVDAYELLQTHRAFLLVDIGRWNEALPILEEATSFSTQPQAMVDFYLGHSCVQANDNLKGIQKLEEALKIGLPYRLVFRARCALGRANHKLGNFMVSKYHFEECIKTADPLYIKEALIWEWLHSACSHLGLNDEAKYYADLLKPTSQ